MMTDDEAVIHHLGGTSAVARMTAAPTSTVHSWKKNGIPASRLAHLRLVARDVGKPLPDDLADLPHEVSEPRVVACSECERPLDHPSVASCGEPHCPRADREAA